jgi:hypothetical protein
VGLTEQTAAQGTYIHAPVPPYCTPRGDTLCVTDDPTRPGVSSVVSDFEIQPIVEFVPVASVEEYSAKLLFLGKSDLQISRDETGRALFAEIRVYSSRTLSIRVARRLKRRFASELADLEDVSVDIERYRSPLDEKPEDDWCFLDRVSREVDWKIECGAS